jgi:hypothetical protein
VARHQPARQKQNLAYYQGFPGFLSFGINPAILKSKVTPKQKNHTIFSFLHKAGLPPPGLTFFARAPGKHRFSRLRRQIPD